MSDTISPAATIIVLRDFDTTPRVLMGQRGSKASFMPNKFVFPGGAVDALDGDVPFAHCLPATSITQLSDDTDGTDANAMAAAAIRELWEETGLVLGDRHDWAAPNPDWADFADMGFQPSAKHLHFFFRAITPPGRSRRFDARFFILNADHIQTDLDDFSRASDELSHLQWVPLTDARALNLPFITEVVLGEVSGLAKIGPLETIPFFKNTDEESLFRRLKGQNDYNDGQQ